jgi:peptide/nickel transport system substrate-binding protein
MELGAVRGSRRSRSKWALVLALVGALSVFAAACGDDGDDVSGQDGDGDVNETTTTAAETPETGGVLVFAQWSEPRSLDPFALGAYGSTGGTEMGAIYDRLVEWDPEAGEYVMRTAESLTPNSTSTEWTLKIRPGIEFSDGTAYDAAAVKMNFDMQKAENSTVRGLLTVVTATEVVDPLTVKFTLSQPWGAFPIVFTNAPGMIVSPAAIQQLGREGLQTQAVGAGPFLLDSYAPKDKMVLKRNPNYWDGSAYLDGVEFRLVGGGNLVVESMIAGGVHAGYLRDPLPVANAKDEGFGSLTGIASSGELIVINNGLSITCSAGAPAPACTGKPDGEKIVLDVPGADLKVRQAIAAALDVNVVNERANDGVGVPAMSLFDSTFPWNPGVDLPEHDLERAQELVEEAKADGWDGELRFTCGVEDQIRAAESIAVITLLESAGITVNTERANVPVSEQVADVITKKDYDIACWGLQMTPDDAASGQIDQFLRSTSGSNRSGYANPEMDAALDDLQAAQTDEDRTAAYTKIAELWTEDVPSVPLLHLEQGVFWRDEVKGIRAVGLTSVALDDAWLSN